ncbi:DUF362 domain-containing protein [Methanohalophilus sp.]|uniref:DUF362 domain-containing protein n=1 Tax=Methanohalophilus sp. TaxID=1966352 RepID=UPI002630340E|nr:DUF362 domain-containing protein [Methanohalophilus sp.]MDK2891697.1 uncharacterized protein [Methanohalophilus sp.]
MKSKVFFTDLKVRKDFENTLSKIRRLFDAAGFESLIDKNELTAIKLHFGERGNEGFISPVHVRQVVDKARNCGANPFLTDTNTLYSGSRRNAVDHLTTAIEHGFGYEVTRAPLVIADGLDGNNFHEVAIAGNHFDKVKIASSIADSHSMIVMSHFKGHELAGFGGAIKNLAMGCAAVPGKMEQHAGLHPEVDPDSCIGCGRCVETCIYEALEISESIASVRHEKCIGCGECMLVCPVKAIDFNQERDAEKFIEMMTEYALGAVTGKQKKVGYMNFLVNITPECDCAPWSDIPLVPDIGILASIDPVAIDAASLYLVNQQHGIVHSKLHSNFEIGEDKFKGVWENSAGNHQLDYGEKIGLGSRDYELIKI